MTKKFNITALSTKHPYRVQYKKAISKAGRERIVRDFRGGTHSYSVALFASALLMAPMFFFTPLISSANPSVAPKNSEESVLSDLISGKGGPEIAPVREEAGEPNLSLESEETTSNVFGLQDQSMFPVVTFTRTFNHLKIANTVMPTESTEVSSDYGWRTPPCDECSADHKGVDFVPGRGKPVFAVADGMVIEMGKLGGYGNYVKLKHLMANSEGGVDEWLTLYAHMEDDSFPPKMIVGSVVKSGDTIGAVGNTGTSTGPHLHFELLINGEHVDPLPLLGTHKVVIVTEAEHEDWMFLGNTFKTVEQIIIYE